MKTRRFVLGVIGVATMTMAVAPAAQASTLFDFLPPEVVALIPSGSADAVNPLLPPTAQPPAPQAAPVPLAPAAPQQPAPAPTPRAEFKNCTEAREAGAAPVYRGDPGYAPHLDRDNDGIGCE
ncbi:MAG: excalibur calcium-binding domain-containing protein [Rhodococcus sp. (in: high G+C Gram-positive bacteria)]|uniref:excalibur calcium-binding domain-containing protein n=1 Tax=Rhodococcus sp. TaxID=1831 RepID=UPI003BB114EC